jgi:hypothetical protein
MIVSCLIGWLDQCPFFCSKTKFLYVASLKTPRASVEQNQFTSILVGTFLICREGEMSILLVPQTNFNIWYNQFRKDEEVVSPSNSSNNSTETLRVWNPRGIHALFCASNLFTDLDFGEDRIPLDPETDVVFDAGCGTGLLCAQMAMCYGTQTYGLEIQNDYIDTYNRKVKPRIIDIASSRIHLERGDLTKTPNVNTVYERALSTATVILCNNVKFTEVLSGTKGSATVMSLFLKVLAEFLSNQGCPGRRVRLILLLPLGIKNNERELLSDTVDDVYVQLERKMETSCDFVITPGEAEQFCYVYLITVGESVVPENPENQETSRFDPTVFFDGAATNVVRQRSSSNTWTSNFSNWLETKRALVASWNKFEYCGMVQARPNPALSRRQDRDRVEDVRYIPNLIYRCWTSRIEDSPIYNAARLKLFRDKAQLFVSSSSDLDGVSLEATERQAGTRRDERDLPIKLTAFEMVAKKDLKGGEAVYEHSQTLSYVLADGLQHRVCAYCLKHEDSLDVETGNYELDTSFKRTAANRRIIYKPVPRPTVKGWKTCQQCKCTHYCSIECQRSDSQVHSKYECAIVSSSVLLQQFMTCIQQFVSDNDVALSLVNKVFQNMRLAVRCSVVQNDDRFLLDNADKRTAVEKKWLSFVGQSLSRMISSSKNITGHGPLAANLAYWYGVVEMNSAEMAIRGEKGVKALSVSVPGSLLDFDCSGGNVELEHVWTHKQKPSMFLKTTRPIQSEEVLKTQFIDDFYKFDVRLRQSTLLVDCCFQCKCSACKKDIIRVEWPVIGSSLLKEQANQANFTPSPVKLSDNEISIA